MAKKIILPPNCGALLNDPLLYNEFQQRYMRARRLRFCLKCKKIGQMDEMGRFTCAGCGEFIWDRWGNLKAPRVFDNYLLLAGRGGGKTLVGAHAVREELMIPGVLWWVMGPNHKWLWDSTQPTLCGLIDPSWVKKWDSEHAELTLNNDAKVAFRSLEDPERARGPHGVNGMWFDEAAQCPERAWDVGAPMLIKAGGVALATTTVLGYDWTYERLERKALVYREKGFWTAKWHTLHNPLFQTNPVMRRKIEQARKTMSPEDFAEEYETERSNAKGLIYGPIVNENVLKTDEEVRAYIKEWPNIDPSRKVLIGLDEGGDHPFGAVLIVVTPRGLVVVAEFLERMRAHSIAHDDIWRQFALHRFYEKQFAANKNALNLRLEWGLKSTGIIQAENKHEVGIQRVKTWLWSKQLKFVKETCPRTIEQMGAYRWAENENTDGTKKEREQVFKLKDELPDAIRYALMAYPTLPDPDQAPLSDAEQRRLAAFDDKTRRELEIMKEMRKAKQKGAVDLELGQEGYPTGNIFQHDVTDFWTDIGG
jgi:hypothetical protein